MVCFFFIFWDSIGAVNDEIMSDQHMRFFGRSLYSGSVSITYYKKFITPGNDIFKNHLK